MNFFIITLVLLVTQSIASDETEKSVESRDAVNTQKEPAQLLKDASDDSELVKAATSQESRFDRASDSDDDLTEKAAEETLEVKSALDEDIVKTVESRSAENIEKSADPAASFLGESDDLEKTGVVSISKSAEDNGNLEKMFEHDDSERSAEVALESEERTVQHDDIKKDSAEDLTFLKSRRMFGDDFLDLKARSGRIEEHRNDNLKSALDNIKLVQNFNPLDSHSTFSQLTPVMNKQVFRSFYTVQPPQVFKFSSHEKPLVTFQNLLPNKRSFDGSREFGNQLKPVNLFTSSEHIHNAYPFQPHLITTQKTVSNLQLPNLPSHVNDIMSKFIKPTDALSNYNTDFSQRSLLLGQPFMPLPLLHQRFPRLIPIRNTLRPFLTK